MKGLNKGYAWAIMLMLIAIVSLVATACGQKPTPPQAEQPQWKVGIVYDIGGRGDLSFNDMAAAGLDKAKQEFGTKLQASELEPTGTGEDREALLRTLAEQGYQLIFGVGFLFTDAIAAVAKDFPNTKFAIIDSCPEGNLPNVACLQFKEHEGSFLVGAAAALKTNTGKVGFVGGMQIPLIEKFEAGYTAGVYYINPQIKVISKYAGTTPDAFANPTKGYELATAEYRAGADIIYHASGKTGEGVFKAATEQKKLAIGVDADQSLTAPEDERPYILTSMRKKVDVAVYDTIKAFTEGQFTAGPQYFGLKEGGVDYSVNDYNKNMMADIQPKLDELKQKIISGEIVVPTSMKEFNDTFKQAVGSSGH